MINNKPTYISLFSSAGVGCYGFKMENFECIATSELIERRLNIQKINNKCKYDSGYVLGDITSPLIKKQIYNQIDLWKVQGNDKVDVIIATPPCQGMSLANHKKKKDEINRNSLIVESVEIIKQILPRFFIFENVSTFWKTNCVYNEEVISIGDMITNQLSNYYLIEHRILNFKNYGSNSSRTRTLVIGVCKNDSKFISPIELFPDFQQEVSLKDVIGNMKSLDWCEYDPNDFYHSFRTYPKHMLDWIKDLKSGQSAFDNIEDIKKPHKVIDGQIIINKSKNSDKYKRQDFNKVAPCIHTRNDQMASQNTIHPIDNRVFSIRELMKMMTIPNQFKWLDFSLDYLNSLTQEQKQIISKKEELNIRQSIGEAVPTEIFRQIASNIYNYLSKENISTSQINAIIKKNNLDNIDKLKKFLINNVSNYNLSSLSKIAEFSNKNRSKNAAYYTPKVVLNNIFHTLPYFNKDEISILEPSIGVGNFLPFIFKKYSDIKKVKLHLVDIDNDALEILKILLSSLKIPSNFELIFINEDYLNLKFDQKFDLIIGNPPFNKITSSKINSYDFKFSNKKLTNLAGLFLEKATAEAKYVSFILPKVFLNNSEYLETRDLIKNRVSHITDFGEMGFEDALIETINLVISEKNTNHLIVKSLVNKTETKQFKKYVFSDELPYWVIYRNDFFDSVSNKMIFNLFNVFRDRQITNKILKREYTSENIQVLKSRNIKEDGSGTIKIDNYDSYIDKETANKLSVWKYLNNDEVFLTPNMTYKPRLIKKEKGYITNGSIAILEKKYDFNINEKHMNYISSDEFRKFYAIARNYQTRSLNIDNTTVYWFGINKEV